MPRSNPSRQRRQNRWRPLSPEELQAQAAKQRAQGLGGPLPWQPHPSLVALQERLELVADCWNLLDVTGGQSRRGLYLPQGSKEPEAAYRQRLANARPSGFFRDALRTYAGMLASVQWRDLPVSLAGVLSDVDGLGTDLGVFLFLADLLVLRDGGALVLVLPAEHRWPSEGHRQEAIRRGDGCLCRGLLWCPGAIASIGNWPMAMACRNGSAGGSGAVRTKPKPMDPTPS